MKYIALLLLQLTVISLAWGAQGETVNYRVDGAPFEGYYVSPSPQAPLVILVHDWDGLTDYEVKRAHMLAKSGFAVFAVDLFGAGIRPKELKDKRQCTGELYADREKMRSLLNGALEFAKSKGASVHNAVAMGYCFGGTAVLEFARSGVSLKGFATFHGGLQTPAGQDYTDCKGKVLILHGTADSSITMEHFAQLARELEQADVAHEMVTYGGAPHAFTVFGSSRYREHADKKSWQGFIDFLDETIK